MLTAFLKVPLLLSSPKFQTSQTQINVVWKLHLRNRETNGKQDRATINQRFNRTENALEIMKLHT